MANTLDKNLGIIVAGLGLGLATLVGCEIHDSKQKQADSYSNRESGLVEKVTRLDEDNRNRLVFDTIYKNPKEAAEKYVFSDLSKEGEKELREYDFSVFDEAGIKEMNKNLSKYGIELPTNYKDFSKSDKLVIQYELKGLRTKLGRLFK